MDPCEGVRHRHGAAHSVGSLIGHGRREPDATVGGRCDESAIAIDRQRPASIDAHADLPDARSWRDREDLLDVALVGAQHDRDAGPGLAEAHLFVRRQVALPPARVVAQKVADAARRASSGGRHGFGGNERLHQFDAEAIREPAVAPDGDRAEERRRRERHPVGELTPVLDEGNLEARQASALLAVQGRSGGHCWEEVLPWRSRDDSPVDTARIALGHEPRRKSQQSRSDGPAFPPGREGGAHLSPRELVHHVPKRPGLSNQGAMARESRFHQHRLRDPRRETLHGLFDLSSPRNARMAAMPKGSPPPVGIVNWATTPTPAVRGAAAPISVDEAGPDRRAEG